MNQMAPCPTCPRAKLPVPGRGPIPARIMAIGQYPGKEEDAKGKCWVGRTGKETCEHYIPLAGLHPNDIYLTNVMKCWPRSEREASEETVSGCAAFHLRNEIYAVKPEIVLLLGAVACRVADIHVEMEHDRPRWGELFGWPCLIWPMFHPAQGLHDYAAMTNIIEGWHLLGRWLQGEELKFPEDLIKEPLYAQLRTEADVLDVLEPYDEDTPLAMDTEFDPLPVGVDPYCMTFSLEAGTGYLIMADDREALSAFNAVVGVQHPGGLSPVQGRYLVSKRRGRRRGWRGPLLLHHAPADMPPLLDMGVHLDVRKIKDTMVLAYNLATLPQGLKTLAYRLCGMEMMEFDDLVTPCAVSYWVAYMETLATHDWPKPESYMRVVPEKVDVEVNGIVIRKETQMVEKLYKPQGLNTKIKRLLTDYRKNPGPDVFKRWWNSWDDSEVKPAIALYGDLPRKSIRMVTSLKDLLNYACRDADSTFRIYPILVHLRKTFREKYNV